MVLTIGIPGIPKEGMACTIGLKWVWGNIGIMEKKIETYNVGVILVYF